jgi:hypothetical protein
MLKNVTEILKTKSLQGNCENKKVTTIENIVTNEGLWTEIDLLQE